MCAKAVADLHHVLRQADTRTQAGQGAFSSKTRNKQSKQSHKRHNTAQHNTIQTKPNQNQPTNNPNTNNQKQRQSTTHRHKTRRKTPRYHTKPNNRCIVAYRLCALRIVTVMSMLSLITTNVDSVEKHIQAPLIDAKMLRPARSWLACLLSHCFYKKHFHLVKAPGV